MKPAKPQKRNDLIRDFRSAPRLLERSIVQIFSTKTNWEQAAVHNYVLGPILNLIPPPKMARMAQKVAQAILEVADEP